MAQSRRSYRLQRLSDALLKFRCFGEPNESDGKSNLQLAERNPDAGIPLLVRSPGGCDEPSSEADLTCREFDCRKTDIKRRQQFRQTVEVLSRVCRLNLSPVCKLAAQWFSIVLYELTSQ